MCRGKVVQVWKGRGSVNGLNPEKTEDLIRGDNNGVSKEGEVRSGKKYGVLRKDFSCRSVQWRDECLKIPEGSQEYILGRGSPSDGPEKVRPGSKEIEVDDGDYLVSGDTKSRNQVSGETNCTGVEQRDYRFRTRVKSFRPSSR